MFKREKPLEDFLKLINKNLLFKKRLLNNIGT